MHRLSLATAPLAVHVDHIVSLGSGAKVSRVAAQPVVAGVHDHDASRDGAIRCFISKPMSVVRSVVPSGSTVTPPSHRTCPRPARIRTSSVIDTIEHRGRRVLLGDVIAGARAELTGSAGRPSVSLPALSAHVLGLWPVIPQFVVERLQTTGVRAKARGRRLVCLYLLRRSADFAHDLNRHNHLHRASERMSVFYLTPTIRTITGVLAGEE